MTNIFQIDRSIVNLIIDCRMSISRISLTIYYLLFISFFISLNNMKIDYSNSETNNLSWNNRCLSDSCILAVDSPSSSRLNSLYEQVFTIHNTVSSVQLTTNTQMNEIWQYESVYRLLSEISLFPDSHYSQITEINRLQENSNPIDNQIIAKI